MGRIIIIFIFLFLGHDSLAQTFSLITDPVQGDETVFHNNLAIDIALCGDKIVVSGQHICHPPTPTSNGILCGSLSSFDFDGTLLNAILLDSFFSASEGGLLTVEDKVFIANFKPSSLSNKRDVYIQEFNQDLELVNQTIIPTRPNSVPNNDGINYIDNHFYVHGEIIIDDGTRSKGFIQKLDANLNLLWDKQYAHEETQNGCNQLQSSNDGGLVFIHEYTKGTTGSSAKSGMQIVKLDSDGFKIDSLEIDREGSISLGLLSDKEGMIYFYTESHPTDDSIFEQSSGRINKYSADLDSLIWSTKFPFNNYTDKRSYNIFNIIEAKNGDIIACGSAFDEGPDGPIATPDNHLFNAFLTRLSKEGEIKWMHFYKPPNEMEVLPSEEFGDFHASVLADIKELEDGRIVAAGTSAFTDSQASLFIGTGDPLSHFLLLAVDGETGCIEGEECDVVVVLDGQNRPRDGFLPVINSDYTWHIEQRNNEGNIENIKYTFSKDSVFQNTNNYHEQIDLASVDNSAPLVLGYFREIGGRIYQKFEGNFNEKLVFDIHLQVGENIEVYRGENNPIDLEAIATDTIILLDGILRKQILLQCLSGQIPNDTIVWVEGIGELDNRGFCALDLEESHILCVQDNNGNSIYNSHEGACEALSETCQSNTFSVGDQWTFERFRNGISSKVIEIVDEREWQGRQALVIEPGFLGRPDYMIQDEGRVSIWDERLGEYQLNYDFSNDSLYYIRFFNGNLNGVDSTAVFIDSVRTVTFNDQEIQVQYCKSELGFEGAMEFFEVYSGIGRANFGVRLSVNLFIDFETYGELRCFDSSDCSAKFVDFPCDTSYMTVSTFDVENDVEVNLYPNPVLDRLYLDIDINVQNFDFQIFNLQGQQTLQGVYEDEINVTTMPSGIYFLQVQLEPDVYRYIKFVKE